MKKDSLGLYIHIPFCVQKCLYCDFCSFPARPSEERAAYVRTLCREIAEAAPDLSHYTVDTVFIGGGTPSLLSAEEYLLISKTIFENYCIADDLEFTSEANPATLDAEKLSAMRTAGINRLSLGMQSAVDNELAALGRIHSANDAAEAVALARQAGFGNINLDLMFGIPHQTKESFAATLQAAVAMAPEHLSVYSLQVEEGTPFYERRASLPLPSEEEEQEMAALLYRTAEKEGYRRYEISNFAKSGRECRHNLRYWQLADYRGFGIAAHSLIGKSRFFNREDLGAYLRDPCAVGEIEEELTEATLEFEYIMLGLRTADGLHEQEFAIRFGMPFSEKYKARISPFLARGLMQKTDGRVFLTEAGMAVSNGILSEILPDL